MTVAEALSGHYREHGLPADGGEQARWFRVRVGPIAFPLPNPQARKRAVFFHDVNHVVTGYNTVFSDGEMLIAGFELGAGCGRFWIAWLINLQVFALGLIVLPRRLFREFVRGRRSKSVYDTGDRASLRAMTVDALRAMLAIPAEAPPPAPADRIAFAGWSVAALASTLGPLAIMAAVVAWVV